MSNRKRFTASSQEKMNQAMIKRNQASQFSKRNLHLPKPSGTSAQGHDASTKSTIGKRRLGGQTNKKLRRSIAAKISNNQGYKTNPSQYANLTVGWDSEFYTSKEPNPKKNVISHQLYILETNQDIFIDCLKDGPVYFRDIINRIKQDHPELKKIFLVTHFSRAELSSLVDGREILKNSRITSSSNTLSGTFKEEQITVELYDTFQMLQKSLEVIAKMIGEEKIDIGEYRGNRIIELYEQNYERFKEYAMNDARIVAKVFDRIRTILKDEWDLSTTPRTVGTISANVLKSRLSKDRERAGKLGYLCETESVHSTNQIYNKVTLKLLSQTFEQQYTNIYFGGRNEAYFRGFLPNAEVYDYDLISAYTAAQSTIGEFDFGHPQIFNDPQKCYDYLIQNLFSFGLCYAEKWSHKDNIKFPAIVQRADKNTVFTLSATQCGMTSHEFLSSFTTMKTITGFHATIYPRIHETSIISEFQSDIYNKRRWAKKEGDEFRQELLKIIGNAGYGKLCQGYNDKKIIDFNETDEKNLQYKKLPKSQISNAFLASYITGLIRAIAFETLNELNNRKIDVLYWTTDGMAITQELPTDMQKGEFGILAKALADNVEKMTGKREIFDIKHRGKEWLGIKTRGYMTFKKIGEYDQICSFTGIQYKGNTENKIEFISNEAKNLSRFKDTRYFQTSVTSVRSWIKGEEYREINTTKAYNWDYDWKRMPDMQTVETTHDFLGFHTIPHQSAEDFKKVRESYKNFQRGRKDEKTGKQNKVKNKILTTENLEEFLSVIEEKKYFEASGNSEKRARGNSHLKLLANDIKFRANNEMGYRKIAKLLNISPNTVKVWLKKETTITNPKKTLDFIINKFKLKDIIIMGCPMILNTFSIIGHPNSDSESIDSLLVEMLTELSGFRDLWEFKNDYDSDDIYSYLIDFVLDLFISIAVGDESAISDFFVSYGVV